jgi:hypothetical protein
MSTARRRLGTGPSTAGDTTTDTGPRLLPVERAAPDALLEEVERSDAAGRKGRRTLGTGVVGTAAGAS